MIFAGSPGAPASHCGQENGGKPITNEAATPVIVEKPYITMDGTSYKLMVPRPEFKKVGYTANWDNADEVDFSDVYTASDKDTAAVINAKLAEGLHVLLQPGNYNLEDSLKVNKNG